MLARQAVRAAVLLGPSVVLSGCASCVALGHVLAVRSAPGAAPVAELQALERERLRGGARGRAVTRSRARPLSV